MGSSRIQWWDGDKRYPDSVAEGTGDQRAINAAICAAKKASFDGGDCVGGDDTATGTVRRLVGLSDPQTLCRPSSTRAKASSSAQLLLRNITIIMSCVSAF